MKDIAALRVAEGWSAGNFIGVALLIALLVLVAWSVIRSFRRG